MGGIPERKYSREQKALIVRLIREDGVSPREAVRLAAEGVDGFEPFVMPASSARLSAQQAGHREEARRRRELAVANPRGCVEARARDLAASVDRDMGALLALRPPRSVAEATERIELYDRSSKVLARLERLTRVSPEGQQPSGGAADGGDLAALLSD